MSVHHEMCHFANLSNYACNFMFHSLLYYCVTWVMVLVWDLVTALVLASRGASFTFLYLEMWNVTQHVQNCWQQSVLRHPFSFWLFDKALVFGCMENPERRNNSDQPEQLYFCDCSHVQTLSCHYWRRLCNRTNTILLFNIILTIQQLCSTHGKKQVPSLAAPAPSHGK